MHADTIAGEQIGVGVIANGLEKGRGEWLSVRPNSPVSAIDHRRFRPPGKTRKARFDRVRLQSIIGVEKGDVPGMSEMKTVVACA
jgi:hypothetical protein